MSMSDKLAELRAYREKVYPTASSSSKKAVLAWGECVTSNLVQHESLPEAALVTDDLSRELSFYTVALKSARDMFASFRDSFQVPTSFAPLMVKGSALMTRVDARIAQQKEDVEAAAKKRKERTMKKVSKSTQQKVLQDRAKDKKDMLKAIEDKKATKGGDGDWSSLVETDAKDYKKNALSHKRQQENGGDKEYRPKLTRTDRNEKYGYGGKRNSGKAKKNTRESTNDYKSEKINNGSKVFRSAGIKKRISGGKAGPSRRGAAVKGANRPGKNKRTQMRSNKKK